MSAEPPLTPPGHEASDAVPGLAGILAAALGILVVAGLLAGLGSFAGGARPREAAQASGARFQDGPASRTSTDESWEAYQRGLRAHLGGYGWIDRPAGIVRLPLERAIDLVCEEARNQAAKEPPTPR